MKHAEKMILVPSDIAEQSKPVDYVLNSLDQEMYKILNDRRISSDLKMIKYNQILNKFGRLHEQRKKPYELSILDTQKFNGSKEIIASIPKTLQPNAKLLLHYIKEAPNIDIEPSGEVVIEGQKIYGSNIVDLIHDFTRDRKSKPTAVGAKELARVLRRSNVPLESIANRRRRDVVASVGDFLWVE